MFDPYERDGFFSQNIYLRERLLTMGYDLDTADKNRLDNCEWVLFSDVVSAFPYRGMKGKLRKAKHILTGKKLSRNLHKECLEKGLKNRMGLFLSEGPTVSAINWSKQLHDSFPIIFTWKDDIIDNKTYFKLYMSYQMLNYPPVPQISFNQKKLLVNISMNKASRHPQELYSVRRASIRYFEDYYPEEFDLYGVGWNKPMNVNEKIFPFLRPNFKSFRGTVKNKWEVLPFYRFCLCYENVRDEPGYISEKIFDAMRCGCVPIYFGAPNISDYVDPEAFIDRRQFKTDAEMGNFLLKMSEAQYGKYQTAINDYLSSQSFAKFLPPAYADTIISTLKI